MERKGNYMEDMHNQGTDFMKETIKQRPLNRRKLLRRTLITAAMAVIFGMVACFTFLLIEPIISKHLYPEEEPSTVIFTEEQEDEILPEDMFVDDSQMQPAPSEVPSTLADEQIAQVLSEVKLGVDDYNSLYHGLFEVAQEVQKSMVTVVGVTSDVDWFNNAYENEGRISGVIIADNGVELLILANIEKIENAETLKVTFADGSQCTATIKKKDNNINLAVLSVRKAIISRETLNKIKIVEMGSSAGNQLVGTPIIAVGQPMGVSDSLCYGFITSAGNTIHLPDSVYKMMTTDIYGSANATGILVNVKGQMIGLIDAIGHNEDTKNVISGVGITELKKVIQCLSNNDEIPYFGVYGADVTLEANENGVPFGAYISEIEMDSPAMKAGIQSGDVITNMDGYIINTYTELISYLIEKDPEETAYITLYRQGPEGYTEMELEVVLEQKK